MAVAAVVLKEEETETSDIGDIEAYDVDKDADRQPVPVPFLKLYKHADGWDRAALGVGFFFAAASGIVAPAFAIILGKSINATSGETHSVMESMVGVVQATGLLCGFTVLAGATWQTCFLWSAARIATRIRVMHLKKVLGQDIAWFDRCSEMAALPTKMGVEAMTVQDAIGTKAGEAVSNFSLFSAGLAIAFFYSWKLTLVLGAMVPVLAIFATMFANSLKAMLTQQEAGFTSAGAVAGEALAAIRTVVAFGGEQHEAERFSAALEPARRVGIKAGLHFGLAAGALLGSLGALYAFALWFGAKELIAVEHFDGGVVITVCISFIIGTSGLTGISAQLMAIARGAAAMGAMNEVLEGNKPAIEPADEADEGRLPPEAETIETVEFCNVSFRYPRRLDLQVLQGLRLTIHRGQKIALVGESGSGKSTVLQLLERFYDPDGGQIRINDIPLTQLPVRAWRRQIGYVGQEPVLFDTTVMANIKGGNPEITDEQAVEAARQAHIYDFVKALPAKFETSVSVGGEQLSGGQKQRIAIARALVKKPQLLLLDEATSALDNESERLVQATVDALQSSANSSLTTITIAHRLSTVRNSDVIFVLRDGGVLERGSHAELLAQEGEYRRLVQAQTYSADSAGADKGPEDPVGGNESDLPILSTAASSTAPTASSAPSSAPSLPTLLGGGRGAARALSKVSSNHDGERSKGQASGTHRSQPTERSLSFFPRPSSQVSQVDGLVRARTQESWMVSRREIDEAPPKTSKDIENERIAALGNYRAPIMRLLRLSRPEWAVYPVGILCAWLVGTIIPLQSYLFTMAFGCFYIFPEWLMLQSVEVWCLKLLLSGVLNFAAQVGMHGIFCYIQECLVKRLRELTFSSALRQEVGYFDCQEHHGAGFCSSLARDPVRVASITGGPLGLCLSACLSVLTGVTIAFAACWKLSLVLLAMMPLMALGIAAAGIVSTRAVGDQAPHIRAGAVATESLLNVRTVRALQAEGQSMNIFTEAIQEALEQELWAAPKKGLVLGIAVALTYPIFIAGLWYGGHLVQYEGLESSAVYLSLLCLLSSVGSAAMTINFVPQAATARVAARSLFTTIDRASEIDAVKPQGWHRSLGSGSVAFEDVVFQYPSRPTAPVLQGLSFHVAAGQAVGVVGASGSGKTTVTQLLQRFYDPAQGSIKVGGVDLRQFDVAWWRLQLGYVGQEPVLFDISLEDNVRYGAPQATKAEVEAAAREANMDYVFSGAVKWSDKLGVRGQRLSGGQKQRCAIARALLRRPQILILDEATSALDSASEHLVQQALETAKSGRTSFTIAHRLSTIMDSDLILVLQNGQLVESGTAEDLMAQQGVFQGLAAQGNQN